MRAPFFAILVATACAGSSPAPESLPRSQSREAETTAAPATSDAARTGTTFAWPVPARIEVHEKTFKKGSNAEMRYVLDVRRAEDGTSLLVRMTDFSMMSVDGIDPSQPNGRKAIRQMEQLASNVPPFVVRADGQFVELRDVDQVIEKSLEFLASTQKMSTDQIARMRQMMHGPQMKARLQEKMADPWQTFVGIWILDELPTPQDDLLVEFENGGTAAIRLESANPDGTLSMSFDFEQETSDPSALNALMAEIRAVVGLGSQDDFVVARYSSRITASVVTDPRTLVPLKASSRSRTRIWAEGRDEPLERLESHAYEFHLIDE